MCGVFFAVRTEFLNIIYTCFGFKGSAEQRKKPISYVTLELGTISLAGKYDVILYYGLPTDTTNTVNNNKKKKNNPNKYSQSVIKTLGRGKK
jgi:hypothetical protein